MRRSVSLAVALAVLTIVKPGPTARAQTTAPAPGSTYVAPYVNPAMAGVPPYLFMNPGDPQAGMLTFLYMQKNGRGIGSGKLSNGQAFRQQAPQVPPAEARPAAYMPRSLASPSAGAERFFGRAPERGSSAPYFNRNTPPNYFNRSAPSRRR
jgi:hypothetical protein